MTRTLIEEVEFILATMPESRNSDITLMIELWKHYYKDLLLYHPRTSEPYIKLSNLFEMPREDNIKRIRAKIQNEERRYLPTNEEVFNERARLSTEWRQFLGYKNDTDFNGRLHTYFVSKFGEPKKPSSTWQAKRAAEKRIEKVKQMEKQGQGKMFMEEND